MPVRLPEPSRFSVVLNNVRNPYTRTILKIGLDFM